MTKNRGGRGHPGRYKTDVVRVPIPIRPQLDTLIQRYEHWLDTIPDANPLTPPNLLELNSSSLHTGHNETTVTHSINFNVPYTSDELFVVPQPRFKFLDEVAVCVFENPELDLASWSTGVIVAMVLELRYWPKKQTLAIPPFWRYQIRETNAQVQRDYYLNYWYDETEIVSLSSLSEEIELEIELALENLEDYAELDLQTEFPFDSARRITSEKVREVNEIKVPPVQ